MIKVTRGTQIEQTGIKLLTLIYFPSRNPSSEVFHVVSQCLYLPAGRRWWGRSQGELGLSVSSQKLFQNLLFTALRPHNFTQHSKGRINPNFDNVSRPFGDMAAAFSLAEQMKRQN